MSEMIDPVTVERVLLTAFDDIMKMAEFVSSGIGADGISPVQAEDRAGVLANLRIGRKAIAELLGTDDPYIVAELLGIDLPQAIDMRGLLKGSGMPKIKA